MFTHLGDKSPSRVGSSRLSPPPVCRSVCNADGTVEVAGVLRVIGGTGTLTTNFIITLDADEKLVLDEVEITGTVFVVTTTSPSGAGTTVRVVDSALRMSEHLQLSPGAVAGDSEVTDSDASVIVRSSMLTASSIDLSASLDWQRAERTDS